MSSRNAPHDDLFSTLISEIKNYNGKDPLLPWLRGMRKMRESLPPQLLNKKLPRFLQKCAQAFQTDRRYTNDLRYLRVWLQLMDFVDDPKAVLRTMEANHIGMKKSLFYQAYALYYEKMKNFAAAEKMYHLGVQNLAEPVDELQKAYEQFLHRMERHKNKNQGRKPSRLIQPSVENVYGICDSENGKSICNAGANSLETTTMESLLETQPGYDKIEIKKPLSECSDHEMVVEVANHAHAAVNFCNAEIFGNSTLKERAMGEFSFKGYSQENETEFNKHAEFHGDDTVVVQFVDTAIVGKSDAEDARHHGLVEPTINTKEAMNAINDMFRGPLEPANAGRRSQRNQYKTDWSMKNGVEIFADEELDAKAESSCQKLKEDLPRLQTVNPRNHQPLKEPLQIFIDDEENDNEREMISENGELDQNNNQNLAGRANISGGHFDGFVFPCPLDDPSECSNDLDAGKPSGGRFREDTVVYRFVGSTILDEPEVENVCHHGLVDPTINLKEAMDDINGMFGKPIEFAKKSRPKKQNKENHSKQPSGGFLILPDDDFDHQSGKSLPNSSTQNVNDLFEQTVCTKEAIAEINKMFVMPLNF